VNTAEKDGLDARLTGVRQVNGSATLLYDAECALCRNCVRWLREWDRRDRLRFEPLQSEVGQSQLRRLGLPTKDFDSMVWVADPFTWRRAHWHVVTDSKEARDNSVEFLLRTDALVSALKLCGGLARVVGTLITLIPHPLRDAAYKTVARLRHWFG